MNDLPLSNPTHICEVVDQTITSRLFKSLLICGILELIFIVFRFGLRDFGIYTTAQLIAYRLFIAIAHWQFLAHIETTPVDFQHFLNTLLTFSLSQNHL